MTFYWNFINLHVLRLEEALVLAHVCDLSTQEVKAGGQNHPGQHSKFQASLCYTARACFKGKEKSSGVRSAAPSSV